MRIYRDFFAKVLREAIKAKGIKQKKLAEDLGIAAAAVSRWCTGEDFPTEDNFKSICNYFGVKPKAFLPENALNDVMTFLEAFRKATPSQRENALVALKDASELDREVLEMEAKDRSHSQNKTHK